MMESNVKSGFACNQLYFVCSVFSDRAFFVKGGGNQ